MIHSYIMVQTFKDDRESDKCDRRSGSPLVSKTPESVQLLRDATKENRRMAVTEFQGDLGIRGFVFSGL